MTCLPLRQNTVGEKAEASRTQLGVVMKAHGDLQGRSFRRMVWGKVATRSKWGG